MSDYVIFTDSSCDISRELLSQWQVYSVDLGYCFDDDTPGDLSINAFYDALRKGKTAKTTGVAPGTFTESFRPILENGRDILYIGFSSGLSVTYNSAHIAAEELAEAYPERKIITVDSLCASAGQGLFIYQILQKKNELDIDALANYAETLKLNICHWFTVDDLMYLKRGGRINQAAAVFGNLLGIKPILHTDDDGKLVCMGKERGRRAAIKTLARKYGESALDSENGVVFISHADCNEDASMLAHELNLRFGVSVKHITYVGPVIGAHCGPGTLALFYLGDKR